MAAGTANSVLMNMRQLVKCALAGGLAGLLAACSGVEKAPPRPESARVDSAFEIDVPQIMRGTVAAEAVLDGYRPTVVRGYGLVVGLRGTGSRDIPPALRAHMLQEIARGGFGSESSGYGHVTPESLLDSEDTAVVIVEAVIPPGSVARQSFGQSVMPGTRFDVRVYADPRTGTTSLEGGRLYTTELRPGPLRVGGGQAFALAHAAGPIFINPFAEPDAVERDTITRTVGLILNGGEVTRRIPVKMRLATPSHARAMMLQNSINARFPQEPGQSDPTARGESEQSLEITVPPSYRDDPIAFMNLLRHSTIRLADPEAVAVSIRRVLLSDPSVATAAAARWQALGKRAIPVFKDLYDYPEELPRLAALRAGAKLNDALVVPHLIEMAEAASNDYRVEAINLLAEMQVDPRIDRSLRELLNDAAVDVRLAAYEALVERRDPSLDRIIVDGGKFVVDLIESSRPMIYITQFGQPRIAVFGRDLAIERPVFLSIWSNLLMIKDLEESPYLEVYYRQDAQDIQGEIHRVEPTLADLVPFLGHTTTIERSQPGLGLSYAETVGALYQIWRQDYIDADFKAEQDRILAAILAEERESTVAERPEFSDPDSEWSEIDPEAPGRATSDLDRLTPTALPGAGQEIPRRGDGS